MGWLDPRSWWRRGEASTSSNQLEVGDAENSFAASGLGDDADGRLAGADAEFKDWDASAAGERADGEREREREGAGELGQAQAQTTNDEPKQPQPKAKRRKPGSPNMYNRIEMPTPEQMASEDFMNNCAVRTVMSSVMGAGLGVVFGIFMGTMDTSHIDGSLTTDAQKKSFRETVREVGKSTWTRSKSYGKGFATMGALFSGSECVIETYRARHDMWNSIYGGCTAGAIMAHSGGPKAMCFGCASFAAFSYLIDRFIEH